MRISTLFLCLLFGLAYASAKDVITKTDGTQLDAKVEEITETLIRYHKASNPTGPIYSIPISSVATILYENGEKDTFNEIETPHPANIPRTSSPSDEDLIRMAESQPIPTRQKGYVSDAELLKIYYNGQTPEALQKKAKAYRTIGWIGGCLLFAGGIIPGILIGQEEENVGVPLLVIGIGVVTASAWTIGFNMKAYSLMKQARQMQSYSSTLFENEIMHLGNNSLSAGINLMGNRITNSHSLGISLGLKF